MFRRARRQVLRASNITVVDSRMMAGSAAGADVCGKRPGTAPVGVEAASADRDLSGLCLDDGSVKIFRKMRGP
ncbi:hypothetical protein GCM10022221_49210 [Actinocorallia aurea]